MCNNMLQPKQVRVFQNKILRNEKFSDSSQNVHRWLQFSLECGMSLMCTRDGANLCPHWQWTPLPRWQPEETRFRWTSVHKPYLWSLPKRKIQEMTDKSGLLAGHSKGPRLPIHRYLVSHHKQSSDVRLLLCRKLEKKFPGIWSEGIE